MSSQCDLNVLCKTALRNARDAFQALQDAEARLESFRREYNARLEMVKKMLAEGGTTGDRLVDLVIRAGGGVDPVMVEHFRTFEKRLAGKKGQLVALAYTGERWVKHTFGRGSTYADEQVVRFGILEAEELSVSKKAGVVFPCEKHALSLVRFGVDKPPEVVKVNLFEHSFSQSYDLPSHSTPLRYIVPTPETGTIFNGLHIGDAEVESFLQHVHARNAHELMNDLRELFGQLVLRPTTEETS